jgi:hypothetical protein
MTPERLQGQRFRWLIPTALIFSLATFGSAYAKAALALAIQGLEALPSSMIWFGRLGSRPFRWMHAGLYFYHLLLFTRVPITLILSATGLLLIVAALALARPSWVGRGALLLCLLSIVALPALYHYEPAVVLEATHGQLRVPTEPGPLGGVVKANQVGLEVRRCDYALLGWDARDALYGEEICGGRHRFWVYWPMSDDGLQMVTTVPDDLLRREVSRAELYAAGVRSRLPQDEMLRIVVREPGLASTEGWWTAFVARHVYGPEDVLVIMHLGGP